MQFPSAIEQQDRRLQQVERRGEVGCARRVTLDDGMEYRRPADMRREQPDQCLVVVAGEIPLGAPGEAHCRRLGCRLLQDHGNKVKPIQWRKKFLMEPGLPEFIRIHEQVHGDRFVHVEMPADGQQRIDARVLLCVGLHPLRRRSPMILE